jgi:hypothetical protein
MRRFLWDGSFIEDGHWSKIVYESDGPVVEVLEILAHGSTNSEMLSFDAPRRVPSSAFAAIGSPSSSSIKS